MLLVFAQIIYKHEGEYQLTFVKTNVANGSEVKPMCLKPAFLSAGGNSTGFKLIAIVFLTVW